MILLYFTESINSATIQPISKPIQLNSPKSSSTNDNSSVGSPLIDSGSGAQALSMAAAVGIAVGVVVILIIGMCLCMVCVCWCSKRRTRSYSAYLAAHSDTTVNEYYSFGEFQSAYSYRAISPASNYKHARRCTRDVLEYTDSFGVQV